MGDFNKAAVTCYCSRNCKISIPKFNIMSAVCVNFRDVARKFARIFKVCNRLISRCLRAIRRKHPLFSMFLVLKIGLSALPKPSISFLYITVKNAPKGCFIPLFALFWCYLQQRALRFAAFYLAFSTS